MFHVGISIVTSFRDLGDFFFLLLHVVGWFGDVVAVTVGFGSNFSRGRFGGCFAVAGGSTRFVPAPVTG